MYFYKKAAGKRKNFSICSARYFCRYKINLMKYTLTLLIIISLFACNNKSAIVTKTFCDTACQKDTLKFINKDHQLQPYVYISAANCRPDSVIWSYRGMGINRKLGFTDLAGSKMPLDKNFINCIIKDTSFAWLLFNDCSNGRGYFVKIPFDKKKSISRKGSAINGFDPKFSVTEGIVAYTDKGNIFIEEMATGKTAMMTFGKTTDMDYDALHEIIDSVNITATRIWAKVKLDNEWKELEKKVTLE
jgi:hypothetical protein